MKILYDYQSFNQIFGGVSRYYYELVSHSSQNNFEAIMGVKYSNNHFIRSDDALARRIAPIPNLTINEFLNGLNFKGKGRLFNFYTKFTNKIDVTSENRELSIQKLTEGNFDVFHPTYFDPYFLKYIGDKPFVLTVYDMTHEIYAEYFQSSDALETSKNKRLLCEKASHIIAVSHNTKKDVHEIFGIPKNKISVVHHGNSLKRVPKGKELLPGLPESFLLFVGQRWIYKNFLLTARVFSELVKEFPKLHLVCGGGNPFTERELAYLKLLGIEDKVVQYNALTDAKLAVLYSNAKVFVYPSLYEGFGIPILEAFENDCPVICSNVASFPEVAGEAALLFDPKSFDSIYNAMKKALDPSVSQKLVEAGHVQKTSFDLSKQASETFEVYKSLV